MLGQVWYAIPPGEPRKRFERMAQGLFPDAARNCANFLRHKTIMVTTTLLHDNNIPYVTVSFFTCLAWSSFVALPGQQHNSDNLNCWAPHGIARKCPGFLHQVTVIIMFVFRRRSFGQNLAASSAVYCLIGTGLLVFAAHCGASLAHDPHAQFHEHQLHMRC